MALQITGHKRVFKIIKDKKEVELPDPNPDMSILEVQKFYSTKHPELNNSTVAGPKIENGAAVYTFSTKAGQLG